MKVIHLDDLTRVCGFFTGETDANNGYGCTHCDQEEFEELYQDEDGYTHRGVEKYPKIRQGKCYSFSCPIATECDLQDLRNNDIDLYNEWKDQEYEPHECGADLMIIHDIDIIKRLTPPQEGDK